MPTTAILGLQWGDEGKGKLVDRLCLEQDVCVRFQGGGNAGHTVYPDGKKIVLHHLPTGVLHKHCTNIMGQGMVVNPMKLVEEIKEVEGRGYGLDGRLFISDRLSVTTPMHLELDSARETGSSEKIGTTKRGIGPTYADRYDRIGVRMVDLLDDDCLRRALERALEVRAPQMTNPPSIDAMMPVLREAGETLRPYVCDTALRLADDLAADKRVLFEGAQGAMLDVGIGTYPFVTSSHTTAAGIPNGTGVAVKVDDVIGVTKAYCTRVGEGPFPTELHDETGDKLREAGGEFGATTGRPRRTGWCDAFALGYVCKLAGVTRLAVTKLDVLTGRDSVNVGVGYEGYDGRGLPADIGLFESLKPTWESLAGWSEDITGARSLDALPDTARGFLDRLAELANTRVGIVSVGPERDACFDC